MSILFLACFEFVITSCWVRVRVRVSKLDEIEEENYVTQRDVIRVRVRVRVRVRGGKWPTDNGPARGW